MWTLWHSGYWQCSVSLVLLLRIVQCAVEVNIREKSICTSAKRKLLAYSSWLFHEYYLDFYLTLPRINTFNIVHCSSIAAYSNYCSTDLFLYEWVFNCY